MQTGIVARSAAAGGSRVRFDDDGGGRWGAGAVRAEEMLHFVFAPIESASAARDLRGGVVACCRVMLCWARTPDETGALGCGWVRVRLRACVRVCANASTSIQDRLAERESEADNTGRAMENAIDGNARLLWAASAQLLTHI